MRKIILNNHQFELLKESVKEKLEAERKEVNTEPTEKQCKAGNYAMGHISINGFEITIENPKGSYRKGKDKNGKEWKTLMHNDYGYFTKTVGKDGDAIDVFLGPYIEDKELKIYPVDQYLNGEFDETKVMMGFRDKESAKKAYLSNYEKDWKGFKYITEVDVDTFKKWLYDGHRQRKPFAKYTSLVESQLISMISESIKKNLITEQSNRKNINMNVEIRKGGRNAVKMTEKEFEEVLKTAWEEYFIEAKPEASYLLHKWNIGNFVYKCCYKSPKKNKDSKTLGALYKDIWCTKYKFDTENVECRGGIKMSNKGVPYLLCCAGGDWECPVCFIVYFDGSKIRAYIPLKGNAINRNTHAAFGGDTEKDAPFIAKEFGISEEEAKQYCDNIHFNEKACIEDFLSRIEVKGTYKEKDYSKIHQKYKELEDCLKKEAEKNNNEITEAKNDKNENIPTKCNKCGGKINLEIHGEPVYVCSECGKYFGTMPCNINENMINEKFNSNKLAQYAKEHGGIEVWRNGGMRNGANAWQRGHSIDLSQVTDDMLVGEPVKYDSMKNQDNAILFNDGTAVEIKNYGEMPAPEKKKKPNRYMTGIGDTGDHDKKPPFNNPDAKIQKQEYNPWGISQKAAEAHYGREAIQNNKNDIDYVNSHKEDYPNWRELTYDANKNIQDIKNRVMKKLDEARKNNPPKDEFAAINKANREDDIEAHGKPTAFRGNITKNPKAYTRKEKHKKVYMTEAQFKNYCRLILQEKRKTDYIKGLLK